MKPRLSPAATVVLPSLLAEREAEVVGGLAGAVGANDLEQRHHLRRVEEVEAEEAVGAPGDRRLVGDRERRGVGGEEGVGLDDLVDLAPHLELPIEVLGDRLDHQVAVGEVGVVERAADPAADRVGVRLLELALLDRAAELLLDLAEALVEGALVGLDHDDVPAGLGADLGDPVPHQPAAEYSYLRDLHAETFLPSIGKRRRSLPLRIEFRRLRENGRGTVALDGREKLFAAFGVIGVIVAIVALVIAIGAKNDANDNETTADATAEQLKTELTDKADKLSAELAKDVEQTSSVGESAKKAQRKGKKAQQTGAAAAKQAAENKKTIAELEQELKRANREIEGLKSAQQKTDQTIEVLQAKLKAKKNK